MHPPVSYPASDSETVNKGRVKAMVKVQLESNRKDPLQRFLKMKSQIGFNQIPHEYENLVFKKATKRTKVALELIKQGFKHKLRRCNDNWMKISTGS